MPQILDRYVLYDVLGSGGMAQVHLGRLAGAAGVSRIVAIKRLHPHLAGEADFVAMFVDEARLATRIHHPNVVATLDVVAAGGELFVVMDYVHGEALNGLLVDGDAALRPSLAIVSAVMCDVLLGLHAAHEAKDERGEALGIVHRDVSPHNVLVGVDGTARIADFGVAKAAGRLLSTQGDALKGKLSYMAPEQLTGGAIGRATDIYAAGVVLWEALTGRRLFRSQNEGEIVRRILEADIEPPSHLLSAQHQTALDTSGMRALDALTLKALATEPGERFATARQMAEALEAAVPPCPRPKVGDWVELVAKDALAKRARFIAALESDALRPPSSSKNVLEEVRSSPRILGIDDAATRSESRGARNGTREGTESRVSNMTVPEGRSKKVASARQRSWLIATAVGLGLVVAAVGWRSIRVAKTAREREATPHASPTSDGAALRGKAMTDWPPPLSTSAEAQEAYRGALQALRRGARREGQMGLRRAVAADPSMAAAHLRLALALRLTSGLETERRQSFSRAVELRQRLSDRDASLLDAFEPYLVRDPPDPRETLKRLGLVHQRFPDDAETAFYVGITASDVGDFPAAASALDRATALDPDFLRAWADASEAQSYLGNLDQSTRAAETCLALSPVASDCARQIFFNHRETGDCVGAEADAKRMLAANADSAEGPYFLAEALAGQDRPVDLVREAIEQYERRIPPEERARALAKRLQFDLYVGDFARAESRANEMERFNASNPGLAAHATGLRWLVSALDESGRLDAARQAATRFTTRYDVWISPAAVDDFAMANDPLPWMLAVQARTGGLSREDFESRRAAWVARWKAKTSASYIPLLWVHGYAMTVDTRQDAVSALEALEGYRPLPTQFGNINGFAFVGRVYLRAGRVSEAVPFLRHAARTCEALLEPVDHTRAILDLGEALEQTGERAEACAAYARVVRRWGQAKPRSITAEKARAHILALHCGK
jgi:eukaryotic-like serine/threonine-protein kinase